MCFFLPSCFQFAAFYRTVLLCLCKPLSVKQRNETEQINIKIGDQAIKTTDNIKLLGVNFDENLIFSQHISELCKKSQSKGGHSCQVKKLNYYESY